MNLFAFGINHQTAPLTVREQVAFHAERLAQALRDLVERRPVKEAAILSTCNRTEVYCNTDQPAAAVDWLAHYHHLPPEGLEPYLYRLPQGQAVQHAFRVASGLDSMMLGEAQILGQMKDAVRSAEEAGTLGMLLNRLFQRTFSVAKDVRTHTEIGTNAVSMASIAVRLAEEIYPSVAECRVLFVGAGEMIGLCATHFAARRPKALTFANRTAERANELAVRHMGHSIALNDVAASLATHDIVIASTASPLPIIGKGTVESALKARKHRPMLLVDLAVPRDIEPEVGSLGDAFVYTVDDLGRIAAEGLSARSGAVLQAEAIIDTEVRDFMHWMSARGAVPAIRALRDQAERSRRHELERALKALERGEDARKVIERLSEALTNKLMHPPTHALNAASEAERETLAQTLARIYQIHRE
ncbi:MAG: glutamyl-tRNA reductase [Betaproteobacteria bacterium]|nr:glutamyl-tRNA reductase [Betaproteobacteria bacterium]